jgi:hypothetical protein
MAGLLGHIQKDIKIDVRSLEHKLSKKKTIWAITHGVVVEGGHWGFTTTYVQEKTAKDALFFFNKNIANNRWTVKAKLKDVTRLIIHNL